MGWVTTQEIEKARQIDLLTYLKLYDPSELVRIGNDIYSTRTHDSLKISNGAWMWFSRGIGGYSALDYLIKVKEIPFVEAVNLLNDKGCAYRSTPASSKGKLQDKKLLLPERNERSSRVVAYLCRRGIDLEIIKYCIENDLLYESREYGNAIFVGYDNENVPRYASYRATNGMRILGDAAGSDKRYCFKILSPASNSTHIFESAIDLLSFATLRKMDGFDWKEENLVSLAGVYRPRADGTSKVPVALQKVLSENCRTYDLHLHFDNDFAGRTSTKGLMKALEGVYAVYDEPPPYGKDFNDYLCRRIRFSEIEEEKEMMKNGRER